MLEALARLIVKKSFAWATVVVVLVVTVLGGVYAARVENDDNLLAFLPKNNPDVRAFYEVNQRFGSLDVALVGVATEDPFAAEFMSRLKAATKKLNETKGVDYALSLANVEDFALDPVKGGVGISYLVNELPNTPAEKDAIRERVMSRDAVVGNLVAGGGKAVLLYCFLAYGNDPREGAGRVRTVMEELFPSEAKFYGGAPFIQSYIFGVTQEDLRRLTPWACLVIVLLTIASFRDAIGTALALFSTVVGIVVALGLMGFLHVKANLVLGSMPVILFALGSAYPIHILTRYYNVAGKMGCERAVHHAVTYLGPTVIASGLITVSGLVSFVWMDMAPIRTFGLFTGIGVLVTLILSMTFVPAVIRLANLKGKLELTTFTSRLMVRFCTMAVVKRRAVGAILGVVAVAGGFFVSKLDSRIDNSSFYSKTSPPARGEAFLREHFGGSQFFQLYIQADMTDPVVLRQIRLLADRIAVLPHVSSVNHAAVVISMINEAFEGDQRVPDTSAKVKSLYGFLAGKHAVAQLVTEDRQHALLHIKVDSDRAADLEAVLGSVEKLAASEIDKAYVVAEASGPRKDDVQKRLHAMVLARIQASAALHGVPLPEGRAAEIVRRARDGSAASQGPVKAAILAYLKSDEFPGDLPKEPADAADRVAGALAALGSAATNDEMKAAIVKALDPAPSDSVAADLVAFVAKPAREILRRQLSLAGSTRAATEMGLAIPAGGKGQRFLSAISNALMDMDSPTAALPPAAGAAPAGAIKVQITGLPVLNRGLSDSVDSSQLKSFFLAMGMVLVIVLVLYRSVTAALLSMTPVAITLLVVYGGMGFLGVHLDIGTSMLASLTTGAGVDYAVHLMAAWKARPGGTARDAAAYSAFLIGRAIWTNAVMVAAGFLVLTMGEARPLQNVGGLTAGAMLVAALATFAAIPVLARKLRYDERPIIDFVHPPEEAEDRPAAAVAGDGA